MKKNIKYIIVLIIMMASIKVQSQNIIVWGQNNGTLPNDFLESGQYYYKDVNNYLNNFLGTWEYINGNEKFQIILTKVVNYHSVTPKLNFNYYEDGIVLVYKKFLNNSLIFQSPVYADPNFRTTNGVLLEGNLTDYGRVTKSVYYPQVLGGGLIKAGGEYFYPDCNIERIPEYISQTPKIKFNLYPRKSAWGETSNPAYDGLPVFSVPNDIIMTKIN